MADDAKKEPELIEDMRRHLAEAAAHGRRPARWAIGADDLLELEEAASNVGLLSLDVEKRGNQKLFGLPYAASAHPTRRGVTLICAEA